MSKLPLWLPPGFDLGDQRRIPVLRIVGVEEGSPEEAVLAERFAGSLRQFFVAQGRNQALGIAPQRRVRVDRGDHQIEYMNQFGQEIVTLHVHPSRSVTQQAAEKKFVPMDFLELRVLGEVVPGEEANSAAYNAMFYAQGLYDAAHAPTTTAVGTPYYQLPNGVAVAGGLTDLAADTHLFDAVSDPNVSNARLAWLDLRGFLPDAVVGVDIYVYHAESADSAVEQVGSRPVAVAFWNYYMSSPTGAPHQVYGYRNPAGGWYTTETEFFSDFPEYAYIQDLEASGEITDAMSFPTSSAYLLTDPNNPPQRPSPNNFEYFTNSDGGSGYTLGSQELVSYMQGLDFSQGHLEYYPGTAFPRKNIITTFYNKITSDNTMFAAGPSEPTWSHTTLGPHTVPPEYIDRYVASFDLTINHICYEPVTALVPQYRPLQFDIWALGRMGGERPREVLFAPPEPPLPPNIGVDELPLVARDIRVEPMVMSSEAYTAGFTVANHFNGRHIGTVYADRKHHAVSFVPA